MLLIQQFCTASLQPELVLTVHHARSQTLWGKPLLISLNTLSILAHKGLRPSTDQPSHLSIHLCIHQSTHPPIYPCTFNSRISHILLSILENKLCCPSLSHFHCFAHEIVWGTFIQNAPYRLLVIIISGSSVELVKDQYPSSAPHLVWVTRWV